MEVSNDYNITATYDYGPRFPVLVASHITFTAVFGLVLLHLTTRRGDPRRHQGQARSLPPGCDANTRTHVYRLNRTQRTTEWKWNVLMSLYANCDDAMNSWINI